MRPLSKGPKPVVNGGTRTDGGRFKNNFNEVRVRETKTPKEGKKKRNESKITLKSSPSSMYVHQLVFRKCNSHL